MQSVHFVGGGWLMRSGVVHDRFRFYVLPRDFSMLWAVRYLVNLGVYNNNIFYSNCTIQLQKKRNNSAQ